MQDLWNDLRIAARRLKRSPGFALMAVLTLTTAIAANLVVFGVVNAAILRPLDLPGADRLRMIEQKRHGDIAQSYPDVRDFQERNRSFSALAGYRMGAAAISTGTAQQLWDYEVTGNYFDMLGVKPELGRLLHASDERGPNSAPYIVLSDGLWRARFGADPGVIGRKVELNRRPFTVIGVTPPAFHGTELFLWPDFFVPLVNEQQIDGYNFLNERSNHEIYLAGMLRPGVTAQQAAADLNQIAAQLARDYPATNEGMGVRLTRVGLLGDVLGDAARQFLTGTLLLSLLVLAAACVNLATIFAARAADRGRELAIRLAIGSDRWRILRQVVAEAALLSLAGGIAGLLAADAAMRLLSRWQPIAAYPIHLTVVADGRVYAAALFLAITSAVLPAVLTARQIWQTDAMQAMKPGAVQGVFRKMTMRDWLLGVQVALCALLVTCGIVGARGLSRALHAPLGFEPQGAVLASSQMKMAGYSDASALSVEKRMIEQALEIPGVTAAGTTDVPPLNGGNSMTPVYRAGTTDFRNSNSAAVAKYFLLSPGLVRAAGMRLLTGRDFTWHDNAQTPRVAIINETLAHTLFGAAPAVGQHFSEPGHPPLTFTVIGVVADGKYDSLTENPEPAMYWALAQENENDVTLVVRSARPTAEIAAALSSMMSRIDPALPVRIESWPEALGLALFPARVATVALSVLGLLAAMLAITGIFGLASYTVARRMRELGIRAALGARRTQVIDAALRRPCLLLAGGSVAGLILSAAAGRILSSIVYHATVFDPVVIAGSLLAMLAIGAAAAALPARRAIQSDPALLLREE